MNLCPVCRKPLRSGVIGHHYWWPKRRHKGRNRIIEVHNKCEKAYHAFWFEHCEDKHYCVGCKYTRICYCAEGG